MKKFVKLASLILACCIFSACNNEIDSGREGIERFMALCSESGGEYESGLENSGEFGVCKCGGKPCGKGYVCVKGMGVCADESEWGFEVLCKLSGGEAEEKRCKCGVNQCAQGVICSPDDPKQCGLKDSCTQEGAKRCVIDINSDNPDIVAGAHEEMCVNEQWQFSKACGTKACDGAMTACEPCASGAKICKNNAEGVGSVYECTGGEFQLSGNACQNVSCGVGADGNVACGECLNGKERCMETDGIGRIQACEDGAWKEKKFCLSEAGETASCKSESECGQCKTGVKKCGHNAEKNTGAISVCVNGMEDVTLCNDVSCYAKGNGEIVCGECRNGDTQCEDIASIANLRTCVDGRFGERKYTTDVSCAGPELGECINKSERCRNDEYGIGWVEQCISGRWKVKTTCDGLSCGGKNGVDCGACLNGWSRQQTGDQICVDGNYQPADAGDRLDGCDNIIERKLSNGNKVYRCSTCTAEDKPVCLGDILQVCHIDLGNNGGYVVNQSCANGCDGEAAACREAAE